MKWRIAITLFLLLIWALALNHIAHQKSLREQLIGTWTLESNEPQGRLIIEPSGKFTYVVIGRFPEYFCDRMQTGARDDKEAANALSFFGTYRVNDGEKTITFRIERSSAPELNDADQRRTITSVTTDELRLADISDQKSFCVWKRAKVAILPDRAEQQELALFRP